MMFDVIPERRCAWCGDAGPVWSVVIEPPGPPAEGPFPMAGAACEDCAEQLVELVTEHQLVSEWRVLYGPVSGYP